MKVMVLAGAAWAAMACALRVSRGEVLELEVAAGPHPRRDTPVSLEAPESARSARLLETTGGGEREVAVQIEPAASGRAPRVWWILAGETRAGGVRRFRLALSGEGGAGAGGASVLRIHDEAGKHLEVRQGDLPVLRYNYGKVPPPEPSISPIQARSAYLHPLWSPAGRVLTMDYPRNHLHHRGVWFPWVETEFEGRRPDFWNLFKGTGTVEFQALEGTFAGPVAAGFRARQRHLDLSAPGGARAALDEVWEVRVYAVGGGRPAHFLFDLESSQKCAGESPLKLRQNRYGGLGIRGSWDWEGDALRVFTSEGKGRQNGEGAPARWFGASGPVGGEWASFAVLGHPSNFRAPQPVRVHPTEPFLNFAPVKAGDFEIAPGKPYLSRYRFYLHDGVLRADEAERLWIDWAEPPEVKVVRRGP